MRISDWSSDVCSSDLSEARRRLPGWANQHTRAAQRLRRLEPGLVGQVVADEDRRPPRHFRSRRKGAHRRALVRAGALQFDHHLAVLADEAMLARTRPRPSMRVFLRGGRKPIVERSEEHTSELQSLMRI